MVRRAWLAASLLALPAVAAEPPPPPPDPEFLEFLAQTAGEDEDFATFIESPKFERLLQELEKQQATAEDEDHEP